MFAALLRPLAQKSRWGLPNSGSDCSQLAVPEIGVDLLVTGSLRWALWCT